MSGGFSQELKIIARAYNQAKSGLDDTARSVREVGRAASETTAASTRLNQAFGAAVLQANQYRQSASGLYVPLSQVAEAEAKVEQQAKRTGQEVDRSTKTLRDHKDQTQSAGDALQSFYQTLGALGLLRGFQVALQGVISTYRQFNAEITQASLIAEDYTGTLQRQALAATDGIYGPRELAGVYRDLGAAGLTANQVLAATPPVLDFATAAMIEQADAAQAVIAATSSFRIPFSQAGRIADAFAEAMNRTTLGGRDLVLALASVGPVAGLAGQGLGQTLAAVAALRNAGARAEDAATSVRSAMLHLTAPTEEAAGMMKDLGIEIFDAQGQMKQWSDIVAEFERALAPYNQQTRNMILTTILQSDGIRAMAASMQMGSGQVGQLAADLESAEGSAGRMADAMGNTLDGAIRRVAGNAQRAGIVIGGDLGPALTSVVGFVDLLVNGFVHLDDETRRLLERILGGAGLVIALASVARVLQVLGPGFSTLFGWLQKIGPAATTAAAATETAAAAGKAASLSLGSMLGILGLVAALAGVAYGAWRTYKAGEEQATLAGVDHATALRDQAERLRELKDELTVLASKTTPTADEQARLKQITGELVKLAPEAATGIDLMAGRVRNLGDVLAGTNTAMERMMRQSQDLASAGAAVAASRLPRLEGEKTDVDAQLRRLTAAASGGPDALKRFYYGDPASIAATLAPYVSEADAAAAAAQQLASISATEVTKRAESELSELIEKSAALAEEIARLQAIQQTAAGIVDPHAEALRIMRQMESRPGTSGAGTGGGDQSLPPGGGGPAWLTTWKDQLQAMLATLDPAGVAVARLGGELDILGAKQTVYLGLVRDGKGGVEALVGAEKARIDTITNLTAHQDALHQSSEAARAMLPRLAAEQKNLDARLAAGAITSHDHAEASETLRKQVEQLTGSLYQNSAAWWRDEQAILSAKDAAGQAGRMLEEAQQRIRDAVYQSATGTMRHEVAMKRLSVDQQIKLYRQMLGEMNLTTEQANAIQEQLVSLFGDKLRQEFDRLADAYQDALDDVDASLERILTKVEADLAKKLGPLKEQLRGLDDEGRSTDRTRAAEDHGKKLADLQKQRRYHELRSGAEHKKALGEIDQQIADESRRWQQQQDDWSRDDQRRAIEEKIQAAEDGAEQERKQAQEDAKQQRADLKDHYDKAKGIAEQGILDTLAALAATDPQWFTTGKGMIDALIAGLQSGDFSGVLSQINGIKAAADAAAAAAQALVNSAGQQTFQPPPSPRGGGGPGGSMRAYASGAWEIPSTEVALLHPGETVLPAHAAQAFRDFAPSIGNLSSFLHEMRAGLDRLASAIQERPVGEIRVYGAETAILEDDVDVDMLSRGVARNLDRARGAKK